MKIEFLMPKDGVEGKMTAFDNFGKPVKVDKIVWEPLFYRRDAAPVVLYGAVVDKLGRLAHKMYLTVSGSRGKLMLTDCTQPVEPAFDRQEPATHKAAPAVAPSGSVPDSMNDPMAGILGTSAKKKQA